MKIKEAGCPRTAGLSSSVNQKERFICRFTAQLRLIEKCEMHNTVASTAPILADGTRTSSPFRHFTPPELCCFECGRVRVIRSIYPLPCATCRATEQIPLKERFDCELNSLQELHDHLQWFCRELGR
jgi:hypothetical protein